MNSPHAVPAVVPTAIPNSLARLSRLAQRYMTKNPTLPDCGHVIFYRGEISGWVRDLAQDRAENGRLTHCPGCVAVPVTCDAGFFFSVGGDDYAGAESWAPMSLSPTTPSGARSGVSLSTASA